VNKRIFDKQTYEEVIWDMIEDNGELNEQTKKELTFARTEVKTGKVHTLAKVKKELKL
jgi:hypothetical protein